MALPVEDPKLRREALVYVIRLYDELTEENGAPTLGTQNRAVDFILADPELCRAVEAWAHPPRAAEGLGSIAAEGDPVIRLWPAISEWRIYHHRAGVAEIKAS